MFQSRDGNGLIARGKVDQERGMVKKTRINLKGRLEPQVPADHEVSDTARRRSALRAVLDVGEASGFTTTYSLKKVLEAVARKKH